MYRNAANSHVANIDCNWIAMDDFFTMRGNQHFHLKIYSMFMHSYGAYVCVVHNSKAFSYSILIPLLFIDFSRLILFFREKKTCISFLQCSSVLLQGIQSISFVARLLSALLVNLFLMLFDHFGCYLWFLSLSF